MQRKGEKMVNANLSDYERENDINHQYTKSHLILLLKNEFNTNLHQTTSTKKKYKKFINKTPNNILFSLFLLPYS